MSRKHFLFVFTFVLFLSSATSAQVPDKEKVVAGASKAFEKFKSRNFTLFAEVAELADAHV